VRLIESNKVPTILYLFIYLFASEGKILYLSSSSTTICAVSFFHSDSKIVY